MSRKALILVLALLPCSASAGEAPQNAKDASQGLNYFVAPNGNDRNPGTIERPFATLYKAHQWVRAGRHDQPPRRHVPSPDRLEQERHARGPDHDPGLPRRRRDVAIFRAIRLDAGHRSGLRRLLEGRDTATGRSDIRACSIRSGRMPSMPPTNPGIQIWAIVKGGYMCAR